ncbi:MULTISPECIES: hypothetical protein [unclassified Archaeoglobus]|jgi:hypothetical protein|uniref:hypothetical protein n=1 Tax=unclassified Archaeoglobus TaxID=2643606 RepID=UPI0025C247BE|nr:MULTISPECIES: hypothetical protein [unclassified Archaeoglobus]
MDRSSRICKNGRLGKRDRLHIREPIKNDLKAKGLLGVQNGREEKGAVVVEG